MRWAARWLLPCLCQEPLSRLRVPVLPKTANWPSTQQSRSPKQYADRLASASDSSAVHTDLLLLVAATAPHQ